MSDAKKKNQASLYSFFKPAQSVSGPTFIMGQASTTPTLKAAPSSFPHPAFGSSTATAAATATANADENVKQISQPPRPTPNQTYTSGYTSSLSPPPSSEISVKSRETAKQPSPSSTLPPEQSLPSPPPPSTFSPREIKASDDEDSDSSLEELSVLLQSRGSGNRPTTNSFTPTTPAASKTTRSSQRFHTSPMAFLPKKKYKFNLESLASHAQKDDATEASSKRVQALLSPPEEFIILTGEKTKSVSKITQHSELLESVIAKNEGGEVSKVARALRRTEATLPELRWYFFETGPKPPKPERMPFPKGFIPKNWQNDLKDPQLRQQTFVSGFAEDKVSIGNTLPDEIFMWIVDEICSESSDILRSSYSNVVRESTEQIGRLILPSVVERMFRALGGSSTATNPSEKINLIQEIVDPYGKREWKRLRGLVKFLGQISKSLPEDGRAHAITMLLRLSLDRLISDNVDLFDIVQESIFRLCRYSEPASWDACCREICAFMLNTVDQSTLRLQMAVIIPSTSPRTHDLKRRLAMSFLFNDPSYSTQHSHNLMDLNLFIERLEDRSFDATPQTDYRELAALTSLLDIALDDARSTGLDLSDKKIEEQFDDKVDTLAASIKGIIQSIGTPGAAFISKIEAKENLLLVSQRIGDTVRSRPKPKRSVFVKDEKRQERMDSWVVKKEKEKDVEDTIHIQVGE